MPKNSKKTVAIDYTSRDFSSIRDQLTQVAERFYPDTFQDFSEASFGAMMLDAVAYVGDQVSFYLDYNVNETFLDTSYQRDNVIRHGRILGYKDSVRPNPVVVATTDSDTGAPTQYAIKAYGNVVSGFFNMEEVECGAFERFKSIQLNSANVSEIISVFDSDGNEYFEVEYLSQDTVFKELSNKNYKNDNTPSVMKPMLVNRKFVTVFDGGGVTLQFGSGDELAADLVADPQDVAMDIFGKNYVTDTTFDPSRLVNNKYYGIVPQNTTLTIMFRQSNPINSNIAASSLDTVASSLLEFEDIGVLAGTLTTTVRNSLEVINEEPIVGNVTNPSTAEIKQRIYDTFPTQNRAVTQQDYENLVYRLPAKFGSIKRCSVQKDPDSQKRNLNAYVVSEDPQNKLINTNDTIKTNLKTWLNHYRMINDTIDILDPFIINFGINFVIKSQKNVDKFKVLDDCVVALSNAFSSPLFIGESISKSEIFNVLNGVSGINDVVKVQIINKTSSNYSNVFFSVSDNTSPDGDMIICPKNAIFELKFPEVDIKGRLR